MAIAPRAHETPHGDGPSAAGEQVCLLVDDPLFSRHEPPAYHPERPERLVAARAAVARAPARWQPVPARDATREELGRVHDPRFLDRLGSLAGQVGYIDPDTYVGADSVAAAVRAAGTLIAMVDALAAGPLAKGVALLRPPGHHARAAQAMGFCLLNSIAIAAAHARASGFERVAIVDWDVHHGNGTQEIFLTEPSVLYVSTHQYPFYPGTGAVEETGDADGRGYTVNVPLGAGGGDAIYRGAFERVILPVLEGFAPDLVLVSAGFDASARDPLAEMALGPDAFGWMARELARVADASARGRMALVLEGGYDLVALEAGLTSAIAGMLGDAADIGRDVDHPEVASAAKVAGRAWAVA